MNEDQKLELLEELRIEVRREPVDIMRVEAICEEFNEAKQKKIIDECALVIEAYTNAVEAICPELLSKIQLRAKVEWSKLTGF